MRKRILIILAILLAIWPAGCGSRESETSESSVGTTISETTQKQTSETGQGFAVRVLAGDEPIQGAVVQLLMPVDLRSFTGTTDENGEVLLSGHTEGKCLLSVSAPSYVPYADLLTPEPGKPLEIDMQEAGKQQAWWLAFATHDPYSTAYQATSRAQVWLAFSDDGLSWQLADPKPIYECDVRSLAAGMRRSRYEESAFHALIAPGGPALIIQDGRPAVYVDDRLVWQDAATGRWLNRRINQEAVGWHPTSQTDDVNKMFGFFDHQVFPVSEGGKVLLFGRNRLGYGYAGVGAGGEGGDATADQFSVVGYAAMKPGSAGTAFRCEDPRISVLTEAVSELREPCIIRQDDGWLMLVTGHDGLYLYHAASLTGSFEKVPDGQLPDGCLYPLSWQDETGWDPPKYKPAQGLAGASLEDLGNGLYRLYLSKINNRVIMAAETDLSRPLTDEDFKVVIDQIILPSGLEPVFLGNPDVLAFSAVNSEPALPPVAAEPVAYGFSEHQKSSILLNMGSAMTGVSALADGVSVRHKSKTETISYLFVIPNTPEQLMHEQCSAQATVTLPEDPSALGGLLVNWQENGRSNGGVAFMIGHDKWQFIHIRIGQMTGMLSPVGSPEQITLLQEGSLDTPFTEGKLTCTWILGKYFLMIDGQSVATIDSSVWGMAPEPHIAGQIGVCTRSMPGEAYEFSNVTVVDLVR